MTRALHLAGAVGVALLAAPAVAAPAVSVDIPPVHSLVAQVMQGVGEPVLIVQPGASPHGYSMRPSEAAALEASDVVFWVGHDLTPWLERAIDTLADDAAAIELLEVPGITTLSFRQGATFEAHDHGDDHDDHGHDDHHGDEHAKDDHGHDEHGHDDHGDDEHAHDDHAKDEHAHDDHDDHGHDDHGHDHDGVDPHAWLDPENAKVWLDAIAGALSAADPANATAYFQNAAAGKADLDALMAEIAADLGPLQGRGFVVFHDAYHYFEARFGVEAAGAIAIGDAAAPGPARVAEIKAAIADMDAACVFSEPQFEPALVATVTEGTDASTGELDPLGAALAPGAGLYPSLLRAMRDSLVACLGG